MRACCRLSPGRFPLAALLTIVSGLWGLDARGAAAARGELWYRQSATDWHEALPVGNGSLGAMVFGGTVAETIQLNHDTLWSAGPAPQNRTGAF